MITKTNGTIRGCYDGFEFEVPNETLFEVEKIVGDVVYFNWQGETATVYKHYVELV